MTDFPYTAITGKLKSVIEKITKTGVPVNVNKEWLASVGFSADADSTFLSIFKSIGFIDEKGVPTKRWMDFRTSNLSRKAMAEGLYEGYDDLFKTYPNAPQLTDKDLLDFFKSKSKTTERTVGYMVRTFKILCEFADFPKKTEEPTEESPLKDATIAVNTIEKKIMELGTGITININIQLTLPDTTDDTVYEKFFASLKKHLLS